MHSPERVDLAPIQIVKTFPSMLGPDEYEALKLHELIRLGYSYPDDQDFVDAMVKNEYGGDDSMRTIYIAESEGKAVGSFVISLWFLEKSDVFWNVVNSSQEPRKFSKDLKVYGGHGMVTHPDFREHKIARQLFEVALEDCKAVVVVGSTKTPAALVTMANSGARFGYRTFYGEYEVTPGISSKKTKIHEHFLSGYLIAGKKEINDEGVYFVSKDDLTTEIPSTLGFPENIRAAFKGVQIAQVRVGDAKTAVRPILSIRQELLG